MKRIKSWGGIFGAVVLILFLGSSVRADIVAQWTFETSQPSGTGQTIGPFSPEMGSGSASGFHMTSTIYGTSTGSTPPNGPPPLGNGSANSFNSYAWSVGDYYQFQVSTVGKQGIGISWDQASTVDGPGHFTVQYSTDGKSFTQFGTVYNVSNNANAWNATTRNPLYTISDDLSAVTALNNQSSIYIRLTDYDTVPAGTGKKVNVAGSDRVDNFTVTASAVPEPSSILLCGLVTLSGSYSAWRCRKNIMSKSNIYTPMTKG